jgi:3-methyl-2-oxobutanoate hydroxymethyltransferase
MMAEVQKERVAGFREFIDDVQKGRFPAEEHVVRAPEGLVAGFLDAIDGKD